MKWSKRVIKSDNMMNHDMANRNMVKSKVKPRGARLFINQGFVKAKVALAILVAMKVLPMLVFML